MRWRCSFAYVLPCVSSGSYFGYKRDKIENPTAYNDIEREIPEQVWYVHPAMLMLVGGSLPFGAVFIELFFILSAVWLHKVRPCLPVVQGQALWVVVLVPLRVMKH